MVRLWVTAAALGLACTHFSHAFLSPTPGFHQALRERCGGKLGRGSANHRILPKVVDTDALAGSLTATSSTALAASPIGSVVTKGFSMLWTALSLCLRDIKALSPLQSLMFVITFVLGVLVGQMSPFWRRMTSVLDIPSRFFGPEARTLKGRAVSVSDGDTMRLLHVPTPFSPTTFDKKKEKLSEATLQIRLCTIDTPETAKFGKPGQPFGEEAKQKLKDLIDQKMVRVRLLQKDQYGRAVASVYVGRWPRRRAVDEIMLKAGLAEVYQGSGAVYGSKGLEEYLKMEEDARNEKIGIWSQDKRESAAEYKRRTK